MGFALVYAVLLFVQSSFLPGVNIFAHLFGLIGGLVLGLVLSAGHEAKLATVSATHIQLNADSL